MFARVRITLDTRAQTREGTFPVKIALSYNRRTAHIPLGVYLRADQFQRGQVINHHNADYFNTFLFQRLTDAQNALLSLRSRINERMSVTAVRDMLLQELTPQEERAQTFGAWFQRFVEKHPNARTRDIYIATWKRVEEFDAGAARLTFEQVTKDWLDRFFVYMAKQSPSVNARNIHLRNIRAVFNDAIDNDVTTAYPFRRLKIRPVATAKRNLPVKVLRSIFATPVPAFRQKYIDAFRLSFLLIGINPADLFTLTDENLQDGRIVYNRRKTHRLYSIKVEKEAREIMAKYKGDRLLLSFAEGCVSYRHFANRANANLGEIRKGLTFYYARHSWATIAASLDIPEDTIALALGHASANATTAIYIERNLRKVDEANRRVIDYVFG